MANSERQSSFEGETKKREGEEGDTYLFIPCDVLVPRE